MRWEFSGSEYFTVRRQLFAVEAIEADEGALLFLFQRLCEENLSPHTIGVLLPRYGSSTFHVMFSVALHLSGGVSQFDAHAR